MLTYRCVRSASVLTSRPNCTREQRCFTAESRTPVDMLSRDHRFHGLNSLSFAYKRGQVVRGGTAALKYALNKRRTTFRAAVVVSRKVDKSAVVRNRIRRRLYEAIGQHTILEPYDLVFTVYSSQLATADTREVRKLVADLLRRAGVTSGQPKASHDIVKPIKTEGTHS